MCMMNHGFPRVNSPEALVECWGRKLACWIEHSAWSGLSVLKFGIRQSRTHVFFASNHFNEYLEVDLCKSIQISHIHTYPTIFAISRSFLFYTRKVVGLKYSYDPLDPPLWMVHELVLHGGWLCIPWFIVRLVRFPFSDTQIYSKIQVGYTPTISYCISFNALMFYHSIPMIVGFQAIPSPLDFHSILVVQNVPMMSPLCPLYPHDLPIVVGDISPFFMGKSCWKPA